LNLFTDILIIIDVGHGNQGAQSLYKERLKENFAGHSASLSGVFIKLSIQI